MNPDRVVSYAYFRSPHSVYERIKGNSAIQFEQFLPMLVRAHHCIWPDWTLTIHADTSVRELRYWPALEELARAELLWIADMPPARTLCEGMLWRMRPVLARAAPPEVVVMRDIDTITSPADRRCVEEFIASGLAAHVIHFAGAHSGVMGGTLAVRPRAFRKLTNIHTWNEFEGLCRASYSESEWNVQGCDQHLLNQRILPQVRHSLLLHELHHAVRDMGVPQENIRRVITAPLPEDIHEEVLREGDALSPGIGICDEPAPALAFYDALGLPVIGRIRECERRAGL